MVETIWPQVADAVARALRTGQGDATTIEDVKRSAKQGDSVIWAAHEGDTVKGIVAFSILQNAANRVLFVEMLAGVDLPSWIDDMERLLADCRDLIGADTIEASCRDGMVRILGRRGWRRKATIMEAP